MKGKFITFEGGEGAGKSTQIKLLADWLQKKGISVVTTYEPGGTAGADKVKDILKQDDTNQWDGISEILLLYAARHDLITKIIKPALTKGTWVLCDRFADSTLAYQGYGHGVDISFIKKIHQLVLSDFAPDLTLILNADPSITLARAKKRALTTVEQTDRFERQDIDFHQRIYQCYIDLAKTGDPYILLNADQEIKVLHQDIVKALQNKFAIH